MAKKQSASSPREKLVVRTEADILAYSKTSAYRKSIARIKAIKDEDIDYSDIPELTDEQLDRMVANRAERLAREAKEAISIRIDPDILTWLKAEGPGYQTRINALLRGIMTKAHRKTA